MSDSSDQLKDALLDAVVALTRERYSRASADDGEAFIRGYYQRAAPQDLTDKDPIDLYGAAVRHVRLGDVRGPHETLVRVYNPYITDDGWSSNHTVIDVVCEDMPFIVDSVLAHLEQKRRQIHVLVHPIFDVIRSADGTLEEVSVQSNSGFVAATDAAGGAESFLHVEIDRLAAGEELERLRHAVESVIADVRAAVTDWRAMREQALVVAAEMETWADEAQPRFEAVVGEDPEEIAALLRWMEQGYFTFLGYREYDFVDDLDDPQITSRPASGLGIMRQLDPSVRHLGVLPVETTERARQPNILNLTKANSLSTVHRSVPLDYVGIKEISPEGIVTGERRFVGLFTSAVYSGRVSDIPVVRAKVAEVVRRSDFAPGSHDHSRLVNILQLHPRDDLIQIGVDQLEAMVLDILDLRDRRQVSLLVRRDDFGRFLSCLVFVPRDRHSTEVRLEIQRILLEVYHGTSVRFSTVISNDPLARLHIVIYSKPVPASELPDVEAVQARLSQVIRTWDDYLRKSLVAAHGEGQGLDLFERYRGAFSTAYRSNVLAEAAVDDIGHLEALGDQDLDVVLQKPLDADFKVLRCKLYRAEDPITLSQFIPLLHDLGAVVIDEIPFAVRVDGERRRFVYDIGIRLEQELDRDGRDRLREAVLAVWNDRAESDSLARLVTIAGAAWDDVAVLRAYARYLNQLGTPFSPTYVRETINRNPEIACELIRLFHARFDPDLHDPETAANVRREVQRAIDDVASLDADRILRSILSLIEATVRTNRWQVDAGEVLRPALAFKVDLSHFPGAPRPVPAAEIFVYSPRTEGVHLRAGRTARGGLRWSDRMEDYRTEVLGLMKAQSVKNSVIVPAGAKGGFVVRNLPDGNRDTVMAEVVACYQTFIGALLDVTDNLIDGDIVTPARTVTHDGPDPYLVVAADKGTATFSDIANEIAIDRGFWLGDAFASGGSSGYDHKALAITARGAWVAVQRHFRELGLDVQASEFTVVGVGDMSGDVFGNGMLSSDKIRLVAAFDHRHVFIDPNPDAATSIVERQRLFAMPRSSWDDYDRALISSGGGVFARTDKSIAITPPMRAALGIDDDVDELPPTEVIRAILRAPVDLLWNGGIGTYVKATTETDLEVGDRSNDHVRVDGVELRCRVLAEGGNLGVTQRGRIEFAQKGGRINTDAIDNSAGVDCSDHEVNLKILLAQAMAAGDLTLKQRDELLVAMADDVTDHVLADNHAQTGSLTEAAAEAAGMIDVHVRVMHWLEQRVALDRELEALPTDEELVARRVHGDGLTRPELAVLTAYVKNLLADDLAGSLPPGDRAFDEHLLGYFPPLIRERFADLVRIHPLRQELVATLVANELVNRGGISMVHRLAGETSATVDDIAVAHIAAWRVYDLDTAWSAIDQLDLRVPAAVQTQMQLDVTRLGERATRWLLNNASQPIDIDAVVSVYAEPIRSLYESFGDSTMALTLNGRVQLAEFVASGVPEELAARISAMGTSFGFLELVRVARAAGVGLDVVAAVSSAFDEQLNLSWLQQRIVGLPRDDHWETMARSSLRDEFFRFHAELPAALLARDDWDPSLPPGAAVKRWLTDNAVAAERCRRTFLEIEDAGVHDLARVSVAVRALSQLCRTR